MRVRAIFFSAFAAGCVDTAFVDGQFLCEPTAGGEVCPPGLLCAADGRCRAKDVEVSGAGGSCAPLRCEDLPGVCGLLDDGCQGTIECGCTLPLTCSPEGACSCQQAQRREPAQALNDGATADADWINEGKIFKTGDGYARTSESMAPGKITRRLYAFDFGFDIPEGATITGYELAVRRAKAGTGSIKDEAIRLMRGKGAPAGTDHLSSLAWADVLGDYVVYGRHDDLWATDLAHDLVNSPPFGIALRARNSGSTANATPWVEHVTLTVHFRCD